MHTIHEVVKDPHLWEREMLVRMDDAVAGEMYVPGVTVKMSKTQGRSMDEAANLYAKAVALDPHGTQQRIGLARTLIEKKKTREAREHLHRVLEEKTPTNPAEWTRRDVPEARRLLETLPR